MISFVFPLLLAVQCLGFVQKISNRIVNSRPTFHCNSESIQVHITTEAIFFGQIFVKGHSREEDCSLRGNGTSSELALTLFFHKCGLSRKRTPDGITVSTTVIVSFHPYFLTESDGAFQLQCIYRNQNQEVSKRLESRENKSLNRKENTMLPTCKYDILENGPLGKQIPFAQVGAIVYHKWSCTSRTPEEHCMIVHSCVAEDDGGETVNILDEHGCSLDPVLLDNIDYTGNLVAGQSAQVYKFADKESIYFQCQIMIFKKTRAQTCSRPQCLKISSTGEFQTANQTRSLEVTFDRRLARLRSRSINYDVGSEMMVTMTDIPVKMKGSLLDGYDCSSTQNILMLCIIISIVSCGFSFISFYLFCWKF